MRVFGRRRTRAGLARDAEIGTVVFLLVLTLTGLVACPPSAAVAADLIRRADLFSRPTVGAVRLSPDGRSLAYVRNTASGPTLRLRSVDDPQRDRSIDDAAPGMARNVWWSADGAALIVQRTSDAGTHLYLQDLDSDGVAIDLTPIDGVDARLVRVSRRHPSKIMVGLDLRERGAHDLWVVDVESGERSLVMTDDDRKRFWVDDDLRPRLAERRRADGSTDLLRPSAKGDWEPFDSLPADFVGVTGVVGVEFASATVFVVDNRDRDKSALFGVDVATLRRQLLVEDADADIRPLAMSHPVSGQVLAVSANFGRLRRYGLTPAVSATFAELERRLGSEVGVAGMSDDADTWLLVPMDGGPPRYLAYRQSTRQLIPLLSSYGALDSRRWATRTAHVVEVSEGYRLPLHLYLPPDVEVDADGLPRQPLAALVYVHGGPHVAYPWDSWFTNRVLQLLANRGYAVLRVEFRGAGGLGKAISEAGVHEWGGGAYRDVRDVARWAVRRGIAVRGRVGIWGWSYGGYMTLQALTRPQPDFAAGISMYGPSDLTKLIEIDAPFFRRRIADERTEEGRRILRDQSPVNFLVEVEVPLLMTNGGRDRRVPPEVQADPVVEKMVYLRKPFTYLFYPDEPHDYRRAENWISFWAVAERFLARHLGGRYEPYGDDLRGDTSLVVGAGSEFVPGLESAFARAPVSP